MIFEYRNMNAYDFSFRNLIDGASLPIKTFKDRVILIVNTASNCHFTSQYAALEKLYQNYKELGLVVIGVPSNDFLNQEPDNEQTIAGFCKMNYGVTFPMTSKEKVLGPEAHPFYLWAPKILGFGSAPKWNFHKYLIDRKGRLIDYFYPITSPNKKHVRNTIEKVL